MRISLNRKKISSFCTLVFFSLYFVSGVAASLEDPEINDIRTPIENIFNIAVSLVGIVLVAMLAYGIWKSSMSLGDPRGLEGAKQTWTHALFGFAVVVGFFLLFAFLANVFGIDVLASPQYILGKLIEAINNLLQIPGNYDSF